MRPGTVSKPCWTRQSRYEHLACSALRYATSPELFAAAHTECDCCQAGDHAGFTPLHLAAQRGHKEVCSKLAKAGANPVAPDSVSVEVGIVVGRWSSVRWSDPRCLQAGNTPLHAAARSGHAEAIIFMWTDTGVDVRNNVRFQEPWCVCVPGKLEAAWPLHVLRCVDH